MSGKHLIDGYIALKEESSDPSSASNLGAIYTKEVAGNTEFFFLDDAGNVVQITSGGSVSGSSSGGLSYADIDDYAKKTLLDSYATPDIVDGYALASDLANYAEKTLLDSYAVVGSGGTASGGFGTGFISFTSDELDPDATDGSEISLSLQFEPVERDALYMFRNGALMRRVDVLSDDYQEYTLSGTTVSFLATNEAGEWYAAKYIDSYSAGGLTDGYLKLEGLLSDPTEEEGYGILYAKETDGYAELHYIDDYGLVTQITSKGAALGSGGGGSFEPCEEAFTSTASGQETFTLSTSAAINANNPSGYNILGVYVNGLKHKYSSSPTTREYDMGSTPAANTVRVGGLNIGDDVEIVFGV